ncbi:SDR family NAD(P)-dependent oxidoreductase [Deinococcus sonorensis]|uniref:SDR family NAD(P)-dependent oxidoreductase n=2 Tax=Deinococcus sonorensis TaxID=309891 RepID=A0AAU7UH77_9DEIO
MRLTRIFSTPLLFAAGAWLLRPLFAPAPLDLQGQVVLITGGSRGLGLLLAREFAAAGARLALLARDHTELAEARTLLAPTPVLLLPADVTDPQQAEEAVRATIQHYGQLDVLVNNAGIIQVGPAENLPLSAYHEAMDINYFGPLHMMRAARRELSRRRGRILNISSIGGQIPVPHLSSYVASKFAFGGLSESLHTEYARQGIHITTAYPGLMRTGSPRQAQVGGNHRLEYGWFSVLDNAPLISQDAQQAAQEMVAALRRGQPRVVAGLAARVATRAYTLAPVLITPLLTLTARLLPRSARTQALKSGDQSESAITRRLGAKQKAEAALNQRR